MGGYAVSLDDSGGESLGDGLDFSALTSSGDSAFSLDFAGEEPLQGSTVGLDISDGSTYGGAVTDLAQQDFGFDQSLSGISDPAPSWSQDNGVSLNGSGTAASSYHALDDYSVDSGFDVTNLFASVGKYGSALGGIVSAQGFSPNRATVGAGYPNGNPNRLNPTSISGTHAALLCVLAGVLIVVLIAGGD
jgi:hypothetical protein